jgi:hypothetical protein
MEDKEVTDETSSQTETKITKKKHGLLKKLAIVLVIIALIILALGFLLPGLLWPKDLGVRYTNQDYASAMQKLEYIKDNVPTGNSEKEYKYIYGPTTDIDIRLTSAEITAFINTDRPSYYAVKNVQIRVNADNTIDASGTVNVDYVLNEILGGKYSRNEIAKEIPALGILPSNVNLYVNFTGSIVNNTSNGKLNSVSVQGISIPTEYVQSQEAISTVTSGIDKFVSDRTSVSKSNVEKIGAENGNLIIKGSFPSSLTRTKN